MDAAAEIAKAAGKLSESKLARFNAKDLPAQVQELVQPVGTSVPRLLSQSLPSSACHHPLMQQSQEPLTVT